MVERNPKYYTKELLRATRRFDGSENSFARELKNNFNKKLNSLDEYKNIGLNYPKRKSEPENIIWVDASDDGLPATSESRDTVSRGTVVNTRPQLMDNLKKKPDSSLVLSQCVNHHCYNVHLAEEIAASGSVASPGGYTAPGGIFSSKLKSYRLLTSNGGGDLLANYSFIDPQGKTARQVAQNILEAAADDRRTDKFFVKPTRGGGGLGGFRLSTGTENGKTLYLLPDMSRLSGRTGKPFIEPLGIDPENAGAVEELWWLYNKFRDSGILNKNYIDVDLTSAEALAGLLRKKPPARWLSASRAREMLTAAIDLFEKKFNRRYAPLLNHYINFGTWGLRAHYRLSRRGIILETIYARMFQIKFTPEGIGYAGADNISNKQTGELELDRLLPVNPVMVKAIGGGSKMYSLLEKGARAFRIFIHSLPPALQDKVPARLQFDIAPVDGFIGEGNADTARGFCLAQTFDSFTENTRQWFEDSLDYYSFIKNNET